MNTATSTEEYLSCADEIRMATASVGYPNEDDVNATAAHHLRPLLSLMVERARELAELAPEYRELFDVAMQAHEGLDLVIAAEAAKAKGQGAMAALRVLSVRCGD